MIIPSKKSERNTCSRYIGVISRQAEFYNENCMPIEEFKKFIIETKAPFTHFHNRQNCEGYYDYDSDNDENDDNDDNDDNDNESIVYGGICHGWDGESKRCDCGNRRIYWSYDTETETLSYEAD